MEEEEEKPEVIIKEKKEAKRSKSWGRRSTRAKKTISYRSEPNDDGGDLRFVQFLLCPRTKTKKSVQTKVLVFLLNEFQPINVYSIFE